MAELRRYFRRLAAICAALAVLAITAALADDQPAKGATDLFERPVLAIDPGMHTALIQALAVDVAGNFAVTGGSDRTVRVWSMADGKLLRTFYIPVGPANVGAVYTVAISPDGSTIAAGGYTENLRSNLPIYLLDRESGTLIQRIGVDLPSATHFLTFSPDGRYLAATLGGKNGLRVFDRENAWREVFRDNSYADDSYGAAFARDGRLATTSFDGLVRLYRYDSSGDSPNFRLVDQPVKAPSGSRPMGVSFSPNGQRLAVGYLGVAAVDVLDGTTLRRVGGHNPADVNPNSVGLTRAAWSVEGQTLYAVGGVSGVQGQYLLFTWDGAGLGAERRLTYCTDDSVAEVGALPGGKILVAGLTPCLGLMDALGKPVWPNVVSPILDFRGEADAMRVSQDGEVVDFGFVGSEGTILRFDAGSLTLSSSPPDKSLNFAPNHQGLKIEGWSAHEGIPTLDGRALSLRPYEHSLSLAVAANSKRFFLGSNYALVAFDDAGAEQWRWASRSGIWAVNASRDGRLIVTGSTDGAIRWHRADDGRELLALQVLKNDKPPAQWDWVLWTPEGFYEATPGAEAALKWIVNHGPDQVATALPVSAIAKLHRPSALPRVLSELETARALGVDDMTEARLEVQAKTGSAKPPGGVLHVLTIGVDKFGDKAGGLHLDYAAADAHDVASAILDSQKGERGKPSLYADVQLSYLANDKADSASVIDALDALDQSMAKNEPGKDVAVILVSSHGEMIDGQFYLIPYGFDAGSRGRSMTSAISASAFAKKIGALAAHGKVLLLLDACRSGAVGAQTWASDPDAKMLRDAMDLENVAVLTSSAKTELSEELPAWRHGALAKAFLDALAGAADSRGVVTLSALVDAISNEVASLSGGRQHVGMHVNYGGDLFMRGHF